MSYAELHAHSAYSFLDGASMPEALVKRAVELELDALALTDHNGFPGVVQLASAARQYGMHTVIGTELSLASALEEESTAEKRVGQRDPDATHLLVLARDVTGYRKLSHAVGQAMLASGEKDRAIFDLTTLAEASGGHWQILTGCCKGHVRRALEGRGVWAKAAARTALDQLIELFGKDNVAVEITHTGQPLDKERNQLLAELATEVKLRLVATTNAHAATLADASLADALAAIRAQRTLEEMRGWLPAWGYVLRSETDMRQLHADHPHAVDTAGEIGAECAFDLTLVAPQLPPYPVPDGYTEATWLRQLTEEKARERYGPRGPETARAWKQIDHELQVINQLGFAGYFLIVHNIVNFCHEQGIWCQGRGSAANSAVCYALGITAVDAVRHQMLFERFLSPGRSGPPDIDVDIEARRREEVIQYVYQRYGREHAAQVANVITYRPRSAIRDAARVLGYESGQADHWASHVEYSLRPGASRSDVLLDETMPESVATLAARLQTLPRHLGIHSGGMVLCDRPVIDICPVGWATMPGRTVLQWDKDDCAEAGLVKFDLLGLGMLTALRISFAELTERGLRGENGQPLSMHNIPQDDPAVYDLLCAADTVGVFQVESRAQMATLPRIRPRTFYDIVVEVALIRPGPIQGNSVNPYINRRRGREAVSYPHPLVKNALEKTLGVPLFQEQLMQIAIDAAGFSPAQADRLRKAMSAKRSRERMAALHDELMKGMQERGIDATTREEIYEKLQAFADFGFPESHSFSFAYLVYASAWLKVHYPENFYAGILEAQPMGFYSPQTLIADARRHGVLVLPVDVCHSQVESAVEETDRRTLTPHSLVHADPQRGLRLGLSHIKGLGEVAERIVAERARAPFSSVSDLARRCELSRKHLEKLALAGALKSLDADRRKGLWLAEALSFTGKRGTQWFQPTLPGTEIGTTVPQLPAMSAAEETVADITATGISAARHPMEFLRSELDPRILPIASAVQAPVGTRIKVAGIITHRQRPHTAYGVTFISLEDETGLLNIVCSPGMWERYRPIARHAQGVIVRGMVERADDVVNFVADAISEMPMSVRLPSRDFR